MTIDEHFEFIGWIQADMNSIVQTQRRLFSAGLDSSMVDQLQSALFLLGHEMRQLRSMVQDLQDSTTQKDMIFTCPDCGAAIKDAGTPEGFALLCVHAQEAFGLKGLEA